MIKPALQDDAFLEDVAAARQQPGRLHLWWLGQSGFLALWEGRALLLDPYLSDALTKKYAGTDKPHVRLVERVIDPGRLDFVEAITSSHNHADHLDAETLQPLLAANPQAALIVPQANVEFAANRLQVPAERLTPIAIGQPLAAAGFTLHAIPAAHEALETDAAGQPRFISLVVQAGPWTFFHAGDTVSYPGQAAWLRRQPVHLALLPINGRDPRRGVPGNLNGEEAVALAQAGEVQAVVPCHYEMFAFNSVSPQAFVTAAQAAGLPYYLLEVGQRLSL